MRVPFAKVGAIDLAWDDFGDGRPMLLVMGIGAPGVMWPVGLCEALAERGFRVVRFDHRDVGQSTRLDALGRPPFLRTVIGGLLRRPTGAPYGLDDMADDTVGLLDALGLADAHVVGASMGGMIAQLVALRHPARVRSLVSIMSTTGRRRDLIGDPRASIALLDRPGPGREAFVEHFVGLFEILSAGDPIDRDEYAALAGALWDRGVQGDAWFRHLAALLSAPDRTRALRSLRVPTLVIHGTSDPLVPLRAGRATAAAIPGARFLPMQGMGHSLPKRRWPALIDAIVGHADAVDAEVGPVAGRAGDARGYAAP